MDQPYFEVFIVGGGKLQTIEDPSLVIRSYQLLFPATRKVIGVTNLQATSKLKKYTRNCPVKVANAASELFNIDGCFNKNTSLFQYVVYARKTFA